MKIVVDAIGGDNAPAAPVAGAVEAARTLVVEVILVGPEDRVRAELAKHDAAGLRGHGRTCPRSHRNGRSCRTSGTAQERIIGGGGLRLVRDGEADAFVSAGHSGATMAGALFILGRIGKIERPCLTTVFPSYNNHLVVADVGANTDCKPEYLVQFAHMASLYAHLVLGIDRPRVGLLANGEEDTKGDKLVQDTHALLRQSSLNFIGNAEPKDALADDIVDVLIADGFVGNLFLKQAEAVAKFAILKVKDAVKPRLPLRALLGLAPVAVLAALSPAPAWVLGAGLVAGPALLGALGWPVYGLRKVMDYRAHGGVPLLGVNGIAIISHGKSDAIAITSAIRQAKKAVESGIVEAIKQIA